MLFRGALSNKAPAKALAKYLVGTTTGSKTSMTTPMQTTDLPNGYNTSTPTTAPSIIPDPAVYEGETAAALQAYQNALAAIGARRASTLQNYGMTAKVDANGNLVNYGIDPNNQYGQIQQLLGGEGQQISALQHNAMDRGLGLKGLGAQGESQARFQGGLAQQNLGRQFVGEIGQEASDQYQATSAYSAAKLQAQRDAIAQAIQNSWFTPAPQSSTGTQPPAGTSQTNPPAAKKKVSTPTYQRTSLARNMGVGL